MTPDFKAAREAFDNSRAPDYVSVHARTIRIALALAEKVMEPSEGMTKGLAGPAGYTSLPLIDAFKAMIQKATKEIQEGE